MTSAFLFRVLCFYITHLSSYHRSSYFRKVMVYYALKYRPGQLQALKT